MHKLIAVQTFVKVAELESFTAAAEALGLSRTMASKHVADLEAEVGTRLLNRTTRSLSLTEAGQAYLARAGEALAILAEAGEIASELGGSPKGRLRVNAPVSFGLRYLSELIPTFMDTYPNLSVELTLNDRYVDLVEEGYDLAVRIGRLKDSSLRARALATCRMIACASPAYLEKHGRPQAPSNLEAHACLTYLYAPERGVWRFTDDANEEIAVRVAGPFQANNGDVLVTAGVEGKGVLLQPAFLVADEMRDGRLERILPDWSAGDLAVSAVLPPGRQATPKVRAFLDHLIKALRPPAPWEHDL